jgi:hypothetical protein
MYKKPGFVQGIQFFLPNPNKEQEKKDPSFIGYFELLEKGDSEKLVRDDGAFSPNPVPSIDDSILKLKEKIRATIAAGNDPTDEMLEEYLSWIRVKKAEKKRYIAVIGDRWKFKEWAKLYYRFAGIFNINPDAIDVKTGRGLIYRRVASRHDALGIQWIKKIVLDESFTEAIDEVNQSIKRYSAKPEPKFITKEAEKTNETTSWGSGARYVTYRIPICAKDVTPPTYTLKE